MDPACPAKSWSPCFFPFLHHHHHHHHQHHHHHGHHCRQLFVCPHNRFHWHHHHHHHHRHHHVCPNFPQEPPVSHAVPNGVVNAGTSQYPEPEAPDSAPPLLFEEEEEEEDEPVFVLTDEWRDFFAKSEAKRKLEKKLAKKGKKH